MHVRQVIPRDAIPSVDDPTFGQQYDGGAEDTVVVVEAASGARAYPTRYLNYHEIVNDDLGVAPGESGGESGAADPVAVTWCPLCGSAVVYDREVDDDDDADRALEFGVSGKLADDDLVMYDRETGSEWKQSSGECIAGDLEGASLSLRPASMVSYREFRSAHPDGVVLQPPGGQSEAAGDGDDPEPIDYDDAPYDDYVAGEGFGLAAHRRSGSGERDWDRSDDLDPKSVVLGVELGDDAVGFPMARVRDAGGVVRATVGGEDVVVFATESAGVHAYADPGIAFAPSDGDEGGRGSEADDDGATGFDGDGAVWSPATGRASDGRRLDRVPSRRLFAFAWQDDHGPDSFYDPS